jgi:cell division protein FtsW
MVMAVKKKNAPDLILFLVVFILLTIGVIMVFSSSYYETLKDDPFQYLKRQSIFAGIGIVAMFTAMNVPYQRYRGIATPLLLFSLVLLGAVLFMKPVNGSRRWFPLGFFNFQPSELAKVVVILYLADRLSRKAVSLDRFRGDLGVVLAVLGLHAGLILVEPDLGTAAAIVCTGIVIMIIAGLRIRHLFVLAVCGAGSLALAIINKPYRMDRLTGFLDPWADAADTGYQVINSLYALGSGGLIGMGIGNSRQKLGFLPEQNTDFIFAILGEELGFLGTVLVVILFLAFAWRGYRIASRCPDLFGSLLAAGLTTMIVLQAMFNMGVVTGCLPVTGISLPFISYGGSFLLVCMGTSGVLLNISRYIE